jgi:hypothetical protein
MAVNKPVGDKARKGAVKKTDPAQDKGDGQGRLDEARQDVGRVYGREKVSQKI